MRRLTLERLHLRHFKGAADVTLQADGHDVRVYGDNATGKTTLHDAFTWLLFGKDARGQADFQIKPVQPDGTAASGIDHQVEATLRMHRDDGATDVTLSRTYREKWTKQRGSAHRVLTGHETVYHVDGVPTKKRDYDAAVASIGDEGLFRLLTDPLHVNTGMHWTARRDLLLGLAGDVTDDQIIAAHPDLQPLVDARGRRSLDDHRKVLVERRRDLNTELQRIPVRIDEAQRTADGASDVDALRAAHEQAQAALAEARDGLADARATGRDDALATRQRQVADQISDMLRAARQQHDDTVRAARAAVSDADAALRDATQRAGDISRRLIDARALADQHEAEVARLRQRWHDVSGQQYDAPDQPGVCPTCQQALPPDQIDHARRTARDAWRQQQAERLADIRQRGQHAAQRLQAAQEQIASLTGDHDHAALAVEAAEQALGDARATLAGLPSDAPTPDGYDDLVAHQQALAQQADSGQPDLAPLQQAVTAAQAAADDAARALAAAEAAQRARDRIDALRLQERDVAQQIEDTEAQLQMCDDWTRARVALVTQRLNARFDSVTFQLFQEQINGGLAEVCITLMDGVPWDSLNHGGQINAGLDIINALAQHHGFAPPVWIDNAESITHLAPTIGQQLHLIVSADDKRLRTVTQEGTTA